MNYYPHHIGDFNNATRHLTRVERSLYRDLIELYYDTEAPLPAGDFDRLARKVMASTEEERDALGYVLSEFFRLDGDVYRNTRCDEEIAQYRENIEKKARAGKASAEARKQKRTPVEHPLNKRSTNQEPGTNNQEPKKKKSANAAKFSPDDMVLAKQFLEGVKAVAPSSSPDLNKWADTIRLMRERDKRRYDDIRGMFAWANSHSFWRTNILSPDKLREKWVTLEAQMNDRGSPPGGKNANGGGNGGQRNQSASAACWEWIAEQAEAAGDVGSGDFRETGGTLPAPVGFGVSEQASADGGTGGVVGKVGGPDG